MQSVNFLLEPFMFLASCNAFGVFLFLILFLWAHSFLLTCPCFHSLCGSPWIFKLLDSYMWVARQRWKRIGEQSGK